MKKLFRKSTVIIFLFVYLSTFFLEYSTSLGAVQHHDDDVYVTATIFDYYVSFQDFQIILAHISLSVLISIIFAYIKNLIGK